MTKPNHQAPECLSMVNLIAYAPAVFFGVLLLGVILQINFPTPFIHTIFGWIVGLLLLGACPILIVWAQRLRHTLYVPVTDRTCFNFDVGPYRVSRHPTYLSLIMLLVGFALIINSLVMVVLTLATIVFFTFFIIPEEESEMEKLCGGVYEDYKKRVRMWL